MGINAPASGHRSLPYLQIESSVRVPGFWRPTSKLACPGAAAGCYREKSLVLTRGRMISVGAGWLIYAQERNSKERNEGYFKYDADLCTGRIHAHFRRSRSLTRCWMKLELWLILLPHQA